MKLLTIKKGSDRLPCLLHEGQVFDLSSFSSHGEGLADLIRNWSSVGPSIESGRDSGSLPSLGPIDRQELAAPLARPGKVICIGLNYADHAAETGADIPSEPVVFNKFPSVVTGPGDNVELPANSSQVDYEAELVVVIGKAAKRVDESNAMDHVFGYACGNDISARDWQKGRPGGQWLLGKSFDTFAPWGPWITTRDEIADPHQLAIKLKLNDSWVQDSSTSQLIFEIPALIAHLSAIFTLEPGDLIFTGTPPGVGMARKPPLFLKDGDQMTVEIENLGVLENGVVDSGAC